MARVNFRAVRERFTHIDAQFVSCRLGFEDLAPRYVVSLYPWWEHPLFVQAVEQGTPWGFRHDESAYRDVTVFPLNLRECRVSQTKDVTDWEFFESHPLLWSYEDTGTIECNSECSRAEVAKRVLTADLPGLTRKALYRYLDPLQTHSPPFCLGTFPRTLFETVRGILTEMGIQLLISREPTPRATPVLLLIDGEDYLIADDFELDVPEFEHRPEWFAPGGS